MCILLTLPKQGLGLRQGSSRERGAAAPQIIPSRDVKVAGVLGPAAPVDKKSIAVADTAIGMGGTSAWRLAGWGPLLT